MIDEEKGDYIDLKEFSKVQEAVSRRRDHIVVRYSTPLPTDISL